MTHSNWEAVIGLEIHVQLSTNSKIFSPSSTAFGAEPNDQANEIDLGLPGTLPAVNSGIFPKAIAFGLCIDANISKTSRFDRKNYFYPDLPKGYQITQMEMPIVTNGEIEIKPIAGGSKTIRINRAHLEEDAGKSIHGLIPNMTGIDLNRAGIPLLEIVSEPDMRNAEEAEIYAKSIHQLVTYLSISDGNMAEGSFRCDANVSVRSRGETVLGVRTETKNINSFKFLKNAINYEIDRQITILESGAKVEQETRLYDSVKNETRPMRSKETATDYRYFPEPDLLPVVLDEAYIEEIRLTLPELPTQKKDRYSQDYELNEEEVFFLSNDLNLAEYFEECVRLTGDAKQSANWLKGEMASRLSKHEITIREAPVSANNLSRIIIRISDGTISSKIGKKIFSAIWENNALEVDCLIEEEDLSQLSDENELQMIVSEIIRKNPKQVKQFLDGKGKVLGYFVGLVMKETSGKANPKQLNELILKRLNSEKKTFP